MHREGGRLPSRISRTTVGAVGSNTYRAMIRIRRLVVLGHVTAFTGIGSRRIIIVMALVAVGGNGCMPPGQREISIMNRE